MSYLKTHIIGIDRAPKKIGLESHLLHVGYRSLPLLASSNFGGGGILLKTENDFGDFLVGFTGQLGTNGAAAIHPDRELVGFCRNGSSAAMRTIRRLHDPYEILYTESISSPGMAFSGDYAFFVTDATLVRVSLDSFTAATLLTDNSFGVVGDRSRIDVHKDGWLAWILGDSSATTLRKVDFNGNVIGSVGGAGFAQALVVHPNKRVTYARYIGASSTMRVFARNSSDGMGALWSRDFSSGDLSVRGVNFLAVDADETLIVARAGQLGSDRGLYRLDPDDGSTIWHNPGFSLTGCGIDRNGIIYSSTESADPTPNRLLKFDPNGNMIEQHQSSVQFQFITPHPGKIGMFH